MIPDVQQQQDDRGRVSWQAVPEVQTRRMVLLGAGHPVQKKSIDYTSSLDEESGQVLVFDPDKSTLRWVPSEAETSGRSEMPYEAQESLQDYLLFDTLIRTQHRLPSEPDEQGAWNRMYRLPSDEQTIDAVAGAISQIETAGQEFRARLRVLMGSDAYLDYKEETVDKVVGFLTAVVRNRDRINPEMLKFDMLPAGRNSIDVWWDREEFELLINFRPDGSGSYHGDDRKGATIADPKRIPSPRLIGCWMEDLL